MEKMPVEMDMLPESMRELIKNIDPAMLEQLKASLNPETLVNLLVGAMDLMHQTIGKQGNQDLSQLLANIMQVMNQYNNKNLGDG
ncbi:hypothetical protein SAMN02745218_02424 [Desulfofundulus australicus DSM 11792]|uniref:Uncharacterized protein n=1 Tax=Desulfofundulus australicus DSM 11792 TaxID=1121425 RepID=A0A1M5C5X6_9FIRM|nr:hypothetical protein [Desulfofundulus australicus]SHF50080.1 hypothetical protein SAMN02745218_02424 [Desulfofundulus australicus DSM 11792]